MIRFVAGLVIGLMVASAVAGDVASFGYLRGWTVHIDGAVVCSDPFVSQISRAIACRTAN